MEVLNDTRLYILIAFSSLRAVWWAADVVEFEVSRAYEWLEVSGTERAKHAAVILLRELSEVRCDCGCGCGDGLCL